MAYIKTNRAYAIALLSGAGVRGIKQLAKHVARITGALILMTVLSSQAMADSVTFPTNGTGVLPNLAFAVSLAAGRDAPVGTVLQEVDQGVGLGTSGVTCTVQKTVTITGIAVPGDPSTFQTNVPGIGVRFYITSNWNNYFVQAPVTQTLPSTTANSFGHYTRADLVVTGPIGSGTLTSLPSMTVTFSGSCITTVTTTQYLTTGSVITGSTCSVTTPAVQVALPKAVPADVPAEGSTTGSTPFGLAVSCPGNTKVYLTLTDASNVGNRSTTLSLSRNSSAAGVGLQILNAGTPVAYGPDSAMAGNTNQWLGGTSSGGAMNIPLTVQYIRTAEALLMGSVNGNVTFTMSYQ